MLDETTRFNIPEHADVPRHVLISTILHNWIIDNRPAAGTKLPSELKLAKMFSTTGVTIAKSLNSLVQKGVLERKANSGTYIAGNDGLPKKLRIGIFTHEPLVDDNCYISPVIHHFHEYFQQLNADLISLVRTPEDYEETIKEYGLSGVLILAPQENFEEAIKNLIDKGIPVVSIGIVFADLHNHSFGTNHFSVCERAIDYLCKLGHRRIAILSPDLNSSSIVERESGYARGMWAAQLPVNPEWMIRESFSGDNTARLAKFRRIFAAGNNAPSAILLAAHYHILPFYNLMAQLELDIPDDISVIAFDDPDFTEKLTPPLTVFAQPIAEITRNAARQLENQLRRLPLSDFIASEAVLIERASCKSIQ